MFNSVSFISHQADNEKVRGPSTVIQELFMERFEYVLTVLNYHILVCHFGSIINSLINFLCRSLGLFSQLVPFNGRSDYGPFIAEGVDIPGEA